MGCVSSKRVDDEVVYRPPPASIAYFDINTIGEPWLIKATTTDAGDERRLQEKHDHVPLPILEKVDKYGDLAPKSWSEVSKALEDLKPSLQSLPAPKPLVATTIQNGVKKDSPPPSAPEPKPKPTIKKNQSFHTLEEIDGQSNSNKKSNGGNKPLPSQSPPPPDRARSLPALPGGLKPVSQNSFILRDKQERQKGNNEADQVRRRLRRYPLEGLQELCPPGGADSIVLYTTTLHGVRRTFDDCETARQVVEGLCPVGVDIDERDVSLHGEFLRELRDLLGEAAAVPRLFIKGRYVGGVNEVVELNETGRLGQMIRLVRGKGEGDSVKGRRGCEGCGGARFVPCLECNGSCKVLDEEGKGTVRCEDCNENGLMQCPVCY